MTFPWRNIRNLLHRRSNPGRCALPACCTFLSWCIPYSLIALHNQGRQYVPMGSSCAPFHGKYTCYSSFQHRLKRLLKVRPVADDQSLAYLLILGANGSSRSLSVAAHQEWSQEMRQNMKIFRLETSIWNAHVYKYLLKNSCLVQLRWPHM